MRRDVAFEHARADRTLTGRRHLTGAASPTSALLSRAALLKVKTTNKAKLIYSEMHFSHRPRWMNSIT